MADSKLQIAEREVLGITVLTLSGEMLLDDGDLAFGRLVNNLIARGCVKIVVDLHDVTYIDSSGVGMMAAKLKDVRKKGGDLRLMRLNRQGQRLLSVVKLRSTFEVFDDETMALVSFGYRPNA